MGKHFLYSKAAIVLLGGVLLFFGSCRPRKQEIPPIINAHLQVKDDKGGVVDSAEVFLYNNEAAFNQALESSKTGNYSSAGAFQVGAIINGKITFEKIPSNQEYWLLVHDQSSFFPNTNIRIHKDNSEAYYYIKPFQNGTEIFADVTLKPMNALVQFTGPGLLPSYDSTLNISGSYALLDKSMPTYVEVRKGDVGYQLRNTECIWTGAVNVAGGEIVAESLQVCGKQGYTFETVAANFTAINDRIDIYIGQNAAVPITVLKLGKVTSTVFLAIPASPSQEYTFFARRIVKTKTNQDSVTCVYQSVASSIATNQLGICN